MSKVLSIENFHIWSLPNESNFPGYNFSATPQSCQRFVDYLDSYLSDHSPRESLIAKLSHVPRKVVRGVVSRDTKVVVFSSLRISIGEALGFAEESTALNLRLSPEATLLFRDAVRAMQDGIGDFDTLDGQAWFWPIQA